MPLTIWASAHLIADHGAVQLAGRSPSPAASASGYCGPVEGELGQRTPTPLSQQVSRQLSRMPVKNTGPEVRLRSAMHAVGLRFRIGSKLPGHPDIVLTRARLAVFVDGCFWHACPDHATTPKNNREWWTEKLERTVQRDLEKDAALRALGWDVVHVWEHEDAVEAAARIREIWLTRTRARLLGHDTNHHEDSVLNT